MGVGRGEAGGLGPSGFWTYQQNRLFFSFEWEKTNFMNFTPLEKFWKNPLLRAHLEKILPMPMAKTILPSVDRYDHYLVCRLDIWQNTVTLQPDTDIQKLFSNRNRVQIRISETLFSTYRGFRLLEEVAHCKIIHLVSSEASFQPSMLWRQICLWCTLNLSTVVYCKCSPMSYWLNKLSLSARVCCWCSKIGLFQ